MVQTHQGELARLRRLDLNLLVALDCLLGERGVSKAARKLRLSQSTVSDSLARLRRHFDDPLLQGVPRAYELSPLAQRLRPIVAKAVHAADRVFAGGSEFDPAADPVDLRFFGSDHSLIFAAARLSRVISESSRESRVRTAMIPSDRDLMPLLRSSDGLILPHGMVSSEANRIDLGRDEAVLVRAADSAPIRSADALSRRPWVVVSSADGGYTAAMRQVMAAGVRSTVAVELPTFSSVPYFIEGTDRLAVLPRSLTEKLVHGTAVTFQEIPVRVDPSRIALWWHPGRADDPVHSWLRDVVMQNFAPIHRFADAPYR